MPRTAAARKTVSAPITLALPQLAKGEINAGILFQDGKPAHWVVLLPGDVKLAWKDALAWAKKKNAELPTRKEQALLFANAADRFEKDWYWSAEPYAGDAVCAWCQSFTGFQLFNRQTFKLRARAVRRVAI